jgi:tight adherence protein B
MKAASILGVLLALAIAAPASAGTEVEVVGIDAADHPQVAVTLAVPDELAGTDLPASAFTLIENGYEVAAGVWTFEEEPLDVVLVMDTSGSMSGEPLADAQAAALAFLDRMPESARVAVVSFGESAEVALSLTIDRAAAVAALQGLESGGETALYDGVVAGAEALSSTVRRSAIVVLSDGGDSISVTSLGDAVNALDDAGAETFVVALETEDMDLSALTTLATAGSGSLVSVSEASAVAEAFAGIANDLTGRYRLVYLTRATGPAELVVIVSYEGVTSSVRATLDLPVPVAPAPGTTETTSAGTAVATPTVSEPVIVAAPTLLAQRWTMPAGIAAVIAGAVAVTALLMTGDRPKRKFVRIVRGKRLGGLIPSLARRAEDMTERVIQSRAPGRLERELDRAGIAVRPSEFVIMSAALGVAAVSVSLLVFGSVTALLVGAVAMVVPRIIIKVFTARRRTAFADQFEGTLQMLSGSLRAGYGLMQSVATIGEEAPAPTSEEFARVAVENQLGRSVEDSLRAMADRMENQDLRWVVDAIDIQYEVGGDMAEALDNVAETIRDRDQIRRQVKALSAEGRISAIILVGLPFVLLFIISLVNPEYLAELTGTTIGRLMLLGGLVMIGFGILWIRRIVKVVF